MIIINFVSVKRGIIYLLADIKKTKKSEVWSVFVFYLENLRDPLQYGLNGQ